VTLARAQREFGEPELALENLKMAQLIFARRSAHTIDILEEYPIHPSDSSFEEIQFELLELEGIVRQLEKRREEYLSKKGLSGPSGELQVCGTDIGDLANQRLTQCLHNLCGRVRVVKEVNVRSEMDIQIDDVHGHE
jgi:hypothetical protein